VPTVTWATDHMDWDDNPDGMTNTKVAPDACCRRGVNVNTGATNASSSFMCRSTKSGPVAPYSAECMPTRQVYVSGKTTQCAVCNSTDLVPITTDETDGGATSTKAADTKCIICIQNAMHTARIVARGGQAGSKWFQTLSEARLPVACTRGIRCFVDPIHTPRCWID
jgi:hypothetical protein